MQVSHEWGVSSRFQACFTVDLAHLMAHMAHEVHQDWRIGTRLVVGGLQSSHMRCQPWEDEKPSCSVCYFFEWTVSGCLVFLQCRHCPGIVKATKFKSWFWIWNSWKLGQAFSPDRHVCLSSIVPLGTWTASTPSCVPTSALVSGTLQWKPGTIQWHQISTDVMLWAENVIPIPRASWTNLNKIVWNYKILNLHGPWNHSH